VSDDLARIEGVTTAMMVALGEAGIKTIEDLADCATDDLIGWTERKKEKDSEAIKHKGALEGFEIGRKEAEAMILSARVEAGWITAEDIAPPPEASDEPEDEPAAEEETAPETADAGAAAPAKS
jgi:N utilization substance protein A